MSSLLTSFSIFLAKMRQLNTTTHIFTFVNIFTFTFYCNIKAFLTTKRLHISNRLKISALYVKGIFMQICKASTHIRAYVKHTTHKNTLNLRFICVLSRFWPSGYINYHLNKESTEKTPYFALLCQHTKAIENIYDGGVSP